MANNMMNIANLSNAELNKINNAHQTTELRKYQNEIVTEMRGISAKNHTNPDLKRLKRENEQSELRKNEADIICQSLSDTSRSDGGTGRENLMARELHHSQAMRR